MVFAKINFFSRVVQSQQVETKIITQPCRKGLGIFVMRISNETLLRCHDEACIILKYILHLIILIHSAMLGLYNSTTGSYNSCFWSQMRWYIFTASDNEPIFMSLNVYIQYSLKICVAHIHSEAENSIIHIDCWLELYSFRKLMPVLLVALCSAKQHTAESTRSLSKPYFAWTVVDVEQVRCETFLASRHSDHFLQYFL